MTISDSIPIQFWLNGQETFNEKSVCGITKQDCFCQPFQCSDIITLQISDTEARNYFLNVRDESEVLIDQLAFTPTLSEGTYYYNLEFTFNSIGVCNENVQLSVSYIDYSYNISGVVVAALSQVSGTLTLEIDSNISGGITALSPSVDGDLTFVEVNFGLFGLATISEDETDACSATPETLYYTGSFGIGTTMYTDNMLTTELSGYRWINQSGGFPDIFILDGGYVDSDSGVDCP